MNNNLITILHIINDIQKQNKLIKQKSTELIKYRLAPGLANVGNICFHNSITQLFYRIYELTHFLIRPEIKQEYHEGFWTNFINLLNMMVTVSSNEDNNKLEDLGKLVLSNICPILGTEYQSGSQADASELLDKLLRSLLLCDGNTCNIDKSRKCQINDPRNLIIVEEYESLCNTNIITSHQEYDNKEQTYKITNIDVAKKEVQNDPNYDIKTILCTNNFNIQIKTLETMLKLNVSEGQTDSITKLINHYHSTIDILFKSYNGNKMTGHLQKKKCIPNKYLIIHLNLNVGNLKINHKIQLANNIGIMQFEFMDLNDKQQSIEYELIGIVYHSGTFAGGHYISYIKHNSKWYEYNDSRRSEKDNYDKSYLNNSNSFMPYILLYKQTF